MIILTEGRMAASLILSFEIVITTWESSYVEGLDDFQNSFFLL